MSRPENDFVVVFCNRFSFMCAVKVSINIRNAFYDLEC